MMLIKGKSTFDYSKAREKLAAARAKDASLYDALKEKQAHACQICGRPLTDPESIVKGVGPECAEKLKTAGIPVYSLEDEGEE